MNSEWTPERIARERAKFTSWCDQPGDEGTAEAVLAKSGLAALAEIERLQARGAELEYLDTWAHLNGLDIKDAEERAERFMQSTLDGLLWSKAALEGNRDEIKRLLADQFKEQAARDQRREQLLRRSEAICRDHDLMAPDAFTEHAERIRAELEGGR